MMASKGSDTRNPGKATAQSYIDKVVAIPFPIAPHRVLYGPVAKVLDFTSWKESHAVEVSEDGKKSLEQIKGLGIAEQKLWLIKRILEIYENGERKYLYKLCEILYEKSPDGA